MTYKSACQGLSGAFYFVCSDLLWTAPELLRAHDSRTVAPSRGGSGSKAGDVYSFSIILHEILFRCQPYSSENLSPKREPLASD